MTRDGERPEATDRLFDTSNRAMAARFGELAIRRMKDGRECREAAHLAFSYANDAIREETSARAPRVVSFVGRKFYTEIPR